MKIYNTLTRQKEDFHPQQQGQVKFYSCGPTTYDYIHIGNARSLVVADIMNRIFKCLGYDVTFVRNFTDVDDKIIKRAQELGKDPIEHAAFFVGETLHDIRELGILDPQYMPKVTDTMPEIIEMISILIEKGSAYEVKGEVFYHVPSYEGYGRLSKVDREGLIHGQRVQVDEQKKNPADFVLWKPAKAGEPFWNSPWGPGRPGWHIECSAMAKKYLGETIDLHHGGVDLIFPHHENEMAQSEAANGKAFCQHWCHHEFVNWGSEKMSKSLGNVITLREFLQKFGGPVLRQIFLSTHYRARLDWSDQIVDQAINDVERIHQFLVEWNDYTQKQQHATVINNENKTEKSEIEIYQNYLQEIKDAVANDFNTPTALANLFSMIRGVRRDYFMTQKTMDKTLSLLINDIIEYVAAATGGVWQDPVKVLEGLNGARQSLKGQQQTLSETEILKLIADRKDAKKNKNWSGADAIRDQLKKANIALLDHPDGTTTWKYE